MSAYRLAWITDNLAVGHAPMSYDELESIRSQGIDAIVNLCAEFCDLHEIESVQGFEVYYLPTCDDEAPTVADLEAGLDWLDEAIYLGKKVLVHCRQGIGRKAHRAKEGDETTDHLKTDAGGHALQYEPTEAGEFIELPLCTGEISEYPDE